MEQAREAGRDPLRKAMRRRLPASADPVPPRSRGEGAALAQFPQLASLEAHIGGREMFPEFSPDIGRYAIPCGKWQFLSVSATARNSEATLELNRTPIANCFFGTAVLLCQDHDLAIDVHEGGGRATYVVHGIPEDSRTPRSRARRPASPTG